MRCATFCGSADASSTNRMVLDAIVAILIASGSVEVVDAGSSIDLPGFRADLVDSPPPAIARLRSAFEAADVVVVAAPEYAGGVAGTAKNALDWCVGSATLYRKPVAVASAGTSGGVNAREQMIRTLTWQGALVIASLGVAGPRTKFDGAGRPIDVTTTRELAAVAQRVQWAAAAPLDALVERARRLASEIGIDPERIHPAP